MSLPDPSHTQDSDPQDSDPQNSDPQNLDIQDSDPQNSDIQDSDLQNSGDWIPDDWIPSSTAANVRTRRSRKPPHSNPPPSKKHSAELFPIPPAQSKSAVDSDEAIAATHPSPASSLSYPSTIGPLPLVETAFLASAASLMWLINMYFPPGPLLRILFPLPIALVYLRWNLRSAWMAAVVSGLLLTILLGPTRSIFFCHAVWIFRRAARLFYGDGGRVGNYPSSQVASWSPWAPSFDFGYYPYSQAKTYGAI